MQATAAGKNRADAIIDRLADALLADGLAVASLRRLAAASGTSDRMLLYYFPDKQALIAAALDRVAQRLTAALAHSVSAQPLPPDALRRRLLAQTSDAAYQPYLRLFLEIAARAAQGDVPARHIGERLGRGFLGWIEGQVDAPDADRAAAAAGILRAIEGTVFLTAIGLGDVAALAETVAEKGDTP